MTRLDLKAGQLWKLNDGTVVRVTSPDDGHSICPVLAVVVEPSFRFIRHEVVRFTLEGHYYQGGKVYIQASMGCRLEEHSMTPEEAMSQARAVAARLATYDMRTGQPDTTWLQGYLLGMAHASSEYRDIYYKAYQDLTGVDDEFMAYAVIGGPALIGRKK